MRVELAPGVAFPTLHPGEEIIYVLEGRWSMRSSGLTSRRRVIPADEFLGEERRSVSAGCALVRGSRRRVGRR